MPVIFNLSQLNFQYNDNIQPSLDKIDLKVSSGEFILITGASGCGKSTLIRTFNGLIPNFHGGFISGKISFQEKNIQYLEPRDLAGDIGFVFQIPDNQLFMNNVEDEIVFGMENMTISPSIIKQRLEDILDTIELKFLRKRANYDLSGGEKQKVAIASVLAMQPSVLILDEPTSELDPKSAETILEIITKLSKTFGLTTILIEHRIERILPYVDRVIIMQEGRIVKDGSPKKIFMEDLSDYGISTPPIIKIAHRLKSKDIPLTIVEARHLFKHYFDHISISNALHSNESKEQYFAKFEKKDIFIEFENVSFAYNSNQPILKKVNLKFYRGEYVSILGRNGSGKTTLLKHINGILRPKEGRILIASHDIRKNTIGEISQFVGYIFQNPARQFFQETVRDEIGQILKNYGVNVQEINRRVNEMLDQFNLRQYENNYPRYLSVGEQQKVALASILVMQPRILILDEPTHGMDYQQKHRFLQYLDEYRNQDNLVILVTHDVESVAEFSDRVVIIEDGIISADDLKHNILPNHPIFSSQINQLIRGFSNIPQNLLTTEELIQVLDVEEK